MIKMHKNLMAISMLCLVLTFLPLGCGQRVTDKQQVAKDEKIVIKFSHVVAEDSPKGLAAERFADIVRQRTGGYVEVQVFPNSTLFKDGEELDALHAGSVQMIAPATSKMSALFPDWEVLDLPFAFGDVEDVHTFLDGPAGKHLFQQLQTQKLVGLATWDNGFKQMTNNAHPLVKPEDFRGLRFRVMPSPVLQEQFQALGAEAYPMPFNDVRQALAEGRVEGEENTPSNIYTQRFDQVQKFLTLSNHGYIGYVVLVSQDFWDNLPDTVRKVLEDALKEVTVWERQVAQDVNQRQLQELEKQSQLKVYHLTAQERQRWQEVMHPVYTHLQQTLGPELKDSIAKLEP